MLKHLCSITPQDNLYDCFPYRLMNYPIYLMIMIQRLNLQLKLVMNKQKYYLTFITNVSRSIKNGEGICKTVDCSTL